MQLGEFYIHLCFQPWLQSNHVRQPACHIPCLCSSCACNPSCHYVVSLIIISSATVLPGIFIPVLSPGCSPIMSGSLLAIFHIPRLCSACTRNPFCHWNGALAPWRSPHHLLISSASVPEIHQCQDKLESMTVIITIIINAIILKLLKMQCRYTNGVHRIAIQCNTAIILRYHLHAFVNAHRVYPTEIAMQRSRW